MKSHSKFWLLVVLVLGFSPLAKAMEAELVLTVPVETDLGVAGLRETREVWVEMIQDAKKSLDIEQFYVSDEKGEALAPVLAEIRKAAKRGVKVRLLVDKKFFKTYPDSVSELGELTNIEARTIDYESLTGGVQHSKFFVVDAANAYVGSANFDWRALAHIHEVGLRVREVAAARGLLSIFETDWSKGQPVETKRDWVSLNAIQFPTFNALPSKLKLVAGPSALTPESIESSIDTLLAQIGNAKRSLKIQVYEFSTKIFGASGTWTVLEDALKAAAKRGVKVQLLLDSTKVGGAKTELGRLAGTKNIEVRSVKVPKFSGGAIAYGRLVHSKYLIVDDAMMWIGTDNWSKNYFYNSRGVGFVSDDTGLVKSLREVFSVVWESDDTSPFKK